MLVAERFWSKVNKTEGCWEWTAYRNDLGYGFISLNGKAERSHRVSIFLSSGKWPEKHVLHKCDNPPCVRPDHLYEGTDADNMADMKARGRFHGGKFRLALTHCPKGHPYSGENLFVRKDDGARECRACMARRSSERRKNMPQGG